MGDIYSLQIMVSWQKFKQEIGQSEKGAREKLQAADIKIYVVTGEPSLS